MGLPPYDEDRAGLLGSMIYGSSMAGGSNRNDAAVMRKVADNEGMELEARDANSDEGTKPVAEEACNWRCVWQCGHKVWNRTGSAMRVRNL